MRIVSSRCGLVLSSATGQPTSSSTRRTYLMQVAGSSEGARALGALAPAFEGLPDRLQLGLRAHGEGEALDALAVELVGDADLDLLLAVEHVELGQRNAVDAVQLHRLAHHHRIEPAAAPRPAGVGAELLAAIAQALADCVLELGREGAITRSEERRV